MNKLYSLNDITREFIVKFVKCYENDITEIFTKSLKKIYKRVDEFSSSIKTLDSHKDYKFIIKIISDYNKIINKTYREILKKMLENYIKEVYGINPDDVDGLKSVHSEMCSTERIEAYDRIYTPDFLSSKTITYIINSMVDAKEKIHSIVMVYQSGLPYNLKHTNIDSDVIELYTFKGKTKINKHELKIDYDKCHHEKEFVYKWVSEHYKEFHFIMKYVYSNYFVSWSDNQYQRIYVDDCDTYLAIRILCADRVSDISLYISREQHDNLFKIEKIDDIIENSEALSQDVITSFIMNMDIYTTVSYDSMFKVYFSEKFYRLGKYGINEYKLFIKYVVYEYIYRIYNMCKCDIYETTYDKILALFINKKVKKYFSETYDDVNPDDIKKMICDILIENRYRINAMLYIGYKHSIFTNTFTVQKTLYRGNKYKDKTLYDSITLTIPVINDVNAVKEWITENRSSFNKLLKYQLSIETEYYNYLKLCNLTLHQGLLEAKFCFKIEDMCG